MSLILSLESSAKACSVALSRNGINIQYEESDGEWKHSREITLLIDKLLKQEKLKIAQLDAVAISGGPGSYTGLRVGASCAKGICFALDIPLIAIETLLIIAAEYIRDEKYDHCDYFIPTIDARRDEIYYTILDRSFYKLEAVDNHILTETSFHKYPNALICGDGASKSAEIIKNSTHTFVNSFPKASYMSDSAYRKFQLGKVEDVAYYNPFYLKMPNITKSKKNILL